MKYPEQESSTLEFKELFPKNNQIVKTLVGFCNQHGGKILIGVNDSGSIKGLTEEEIEHALESLDKAIVESTCPPIIPSVYAQTIGDKTILIIEVSSGMNKPYYIRSEGQEKGTYIRLGRSTLRATADIIDELKLASRGQPFDSTAVYRAYIQDLDSEKIQRFFLERKGSKEISSHFNTALSAYNLITEIHGHTYPTVAGILLFGTNPQRFFSEAFIICSRFAGIEGREALATRDCLGTLVEQFHDAYNFILSQLNRSFIIKGPKREEKLEIPEEALREALINALAHRNYHIQAPIKIAIYDNRIEIFSPGSFPGPLTSKNLKMGLTYIRNIAITKVFRELGYIEKLGTGFLTIFTSYERLGLQEPEVIEGENYIKCILPRPGRVKTVEVTAGDDFKRILRLFESSTELTIGEVISLLQIPRATAGRKLSKLVQRGYLEKMGIGSGTKYRKI